MKMKLGIVIYFIVIVVVLVFLIIVAVNKEWSTHEWKLVATGILTDADYAHIDRSRTSGEWWTLKFDNGWVIKTEYGSRYVIGKKYEIYHQECYDRYKIK